VHKSYGEFTHPATRQKDGAARYNEYLERCKMKVSDEFKSIADANTTMTYTGDERRRDVPLGRIWSRWSVMSTGTMSLSHEMTGSGLPVASQIITVPRPFSTAFSVGLSTMRG